MQSMWLITDHLYVLQITLVSMEFASFNGFWRLPGTTIGDNITKDLMDQNVKEIGMLHTDNWLCGVGGN